MLYNIRHFLKPIIVLARKFNWIKKKEKGKEELRLKIDTQFGFLRLFGVLRWH